MGSAVAATALGGRITPALLVAAFALSLWFVQRDHTTDYLEFVIWLWLLTPWVRRVVDLQSGYADQNLVLLVAPLASLPGLGALVVRQTRVRRSVSHAFAVALVAIGYATAVGVIRNGVGPAAVGGLAWLAPLGVGAWVATARCSDADLLQSVRRVSVAAVAVLGAYGVYQFFQLPEWDVYWMDNVDLISIGRSRPFEVRVFGPLNAPVPYAMTIGALLIVVSAVASRWKGLAVASGFAGLALSLVRGAWLGFLVALVVLFVGGKARSARSAVLLVAVPVLLLVAIGGPARDAVTSRFDATVERGSEDTSFSERVASYGETLPRAVMDVGGRGFGQVGAGVAAVEEEDEDADANRHPDSTVLEVLLSMGSPIGATFLVTVLVGVASVLRRPARGTGLDRAMAAALVGLLAQIPLANPFNSATGVVFWVLLAVAGRSSPSAVSPRRTVQRTRRISS